ncbi:MAG: DUF5335 family protein [Acidimicrobiales bacterium]|jgi:hypothetical protein
MTKDKEEIRRDAWQKTLEALTGEHEGNVATIEVEDLDLGDQFAAEQIPFSYIEYDPHDDAVSVGVGGLDGRYPVVLRHVVEHPQNVFIHASEQGPVTVEVRSPDGTVTLITLQGRLELPA